MSGTKYLINKLKTLMLSSRNYTSNNTEKLVKLTMDNDGICTLIMDRPPVNSLNSALLQDISKALDEVERSGCKGMILTSAMSTVFSAGLDLNELHQPDADRLREFWTTFKETWIKLFEAKFVTSAAISGHAPAGGCSLALSCEYRVMVPNKIIGLNETPLGIIVPKWLMETMRYTISSRQTELATTCGKLLTTKEAKEVGLIDDVADDKNDSINKCKLFIRKFDNIPPFARGSTKILLREPIINFIKNKDNNKEDMETFVNSVMKEETQIQIKSQLKHLKTKK